MFIFHAFLILGLFTILGKNLFQKAIMESGSALGTWAITEDPVRYTRELAGKLNCSSFIGRSDLLLQCFRTKTVTELKEVDVEAPKYFSAFAPVIDKRSVLPKDIR